MTNKEQALAIYKEHILPFLLETHCVNIGESDFYLSVDFIDYSTKCLEINGFNLRSDDRRNEEMLNLINNCELENTYILIDFILTHCEAYKKANTYYIEFLKIMELLDDNDLNEVNTIIHWWLK